MWGRQSSFNERLDELEDAVKKISLVISRTNRHERKIEIGEEVRMQIEQNNLIQEQELLYDKQYEFCPDCKSTAFLQCALNIYDTENMGWVIDIKNVRRNKRYVGNINTAPLIEYAKAVNLPYYIGIDIPICRCVCGHEWLGKKQESEGAKK